MGISFKELNHSYLGAVKNDHIDAITNINLDIDAKDEFIMVVGKTGSGKSTLVQHTNGLLLPTSGTINIFESIITSKKRKNPKLKPVRRRVGFVFQFPEYQLFEETVLKDIMFAPKIFGYKEEEALARAKEVAKILHIDESWFLKSPFNLSGGEMRKVAIAGILAYEPDILVLDEPTRGLDPKGALEIMEMFGQIHKEFHKTIIMITHDMNIVYKYATRIVAMDKGNIIYDGNKFDLFETHKYKECHLLKPDILNIIDYLNEKNNLKLSYDIKDEQELLISLKGGKINE